MDSPTAEREADARREQISAEIERLGRHDWAGEYCAGDGMGVNQSLHLAPDSGYVFEWHGCLGLYDRNYGAVTPQDGRLRLSFTFENVRQGFRGIAPDLLMVRWGARRYLIPADDIIGFCNAVNSGHEPRTGAHGRYLLRAGDETKEVRGWPELPDEYRTCLLSNPAKASILAVGPSTTRPSLADWSFRDTQVTLDAGSDQGIHVGMELFVIEPRDIVKSVRVTNVRADRADAIMTQIDEDASAPVAGWQLSTQPWWNAESAR